MLVEKELRQNKANYKQLFDQILKYDEQLLSYLNALFKDLVDI